MRLSDHFTLDELTVTEHRAFIPANRDLALGDKRILHNLGHVAGRLELVRAILGHVPIHVTSGYRCADLNRAVGGSKTSAHMNGWAADFVCPAFGSPLQIAQELVKPNHGLRFDQLIMEGTWVHLSFDPQVRREVLHAVPGGVAPGLPAAA